MSTLFSSTPDKDGDHLEVDTIEDPARLLFTTAGDSYASAYVIRDEVTALRDVLTAWLDGTRLPSHVARPKPVTVDDVRTLIAEAMAEARAGQVQPLWAAPQTEAAFCEIPGCSKFPATAKHFEHDPEPGDVGHPRPATACTCHDSDGNSVLTADPVDAALADPAVNWSDRLFGKSVPVKLPRQLVGCECGHRWSTHASDGCHQRLDEYGDQCTCTSTPPVAT